MIYLHKNENGTVDAYGDEESLRTALGLLEGDPIPSEVKTIMEKEWETYGYTARIDETGEILLGPSLQDTKIQKLREIQNAVDATLAPLSEEYPYKEVLSFSSQEKEARAYLADQSTPTVLLTPMAAERGITIEDLAHRIVAKADATAMKTGAVLGMGQRDRDRVAAATTVEEVNAVVPSYKLPEG